jgi:DNA (cytosine-5)-methyltransferase 1
MTHGSLFSGIGGFDLAAEWMGWQNIFHCEWNPFGQQILKYYWPQAILYNDITKTDFSIHRGTIDILTGGFPCQPFSVAGKQKGTEDERHLWPEMLRAIREIQPRFVVGENVPGLVNWSNGMVFEQVQADLEAEGYEVTPFILPAASVNAPHKRERIWFIGHSKHNGSFTAENRRNDDQSSVKTQPDTLRKSPGANRVQSGTLYHCYPITYTNNDDRRCRTGKWIQEDQAEWRDLHMLFTGSCSKRASTNANSRRRRKICRYAARHWGKAKEFSKYCNPCSYANVSNTNGIGLWRKGDRIRESRQLNEAIQANNWSNFPTQSPVCDGDDGLPTSLDGITFSKWRNESIKGGGNAIVPEVALQIFQAIQQYEQLCG